MALFDQSAGDYDAWYQNPVGRFVDTVETQCLFSLADKLSGADILDLGCGTGHLSEMLQNRGANVTGIDISPNMLQKARESSEHLGLGINYRLMDVHDLCFDADTFEAVFSMVAVEFIPDTDLAFKNVAKVVKRGGAVIIGTIQKGSAWADMYQSDAFAQTVFSKACFKQLSDFQRIDGFEVVTSKECLFVPPGLDENAYTRDNDMREEQNGRKGGFLCVKMIKR